MMLSFFMDQALFQILILCFCHLIIQGSFKRKEEKRTGEPEMKNNNIRPRDVAMSINAVVIWMAIIGFQTTHNPLFMSMGVGFVVAGFVGMAMFRKSYISDSKQAITALSEYINSMDKKSGKQLEMLRSLHSWPSYFISNKQK